eukprot:7242816-Pyramimonas_sp.AAC.1
MVQEEKRHSALCKKELTSALTSARAGKASSLRTTAEEVRDMTHEVRRPDTDLLLPTTFWWSTLRAGSRGPQVCIERPKKGVKLCGVEYPPV